MGERRNLRREREKGNSLGEGGPITNFGHGHKHVEIAVPLGGDRGPVGEAAVAVDGGEGGEVTDALKYLDELDKYYSQVARPRFGKRSSHPLDSILSHYYKN